MRWIAALGLLAVPLLTAAGSMAQLASPPRPAINIDRDEPLFEYHFGYSPTGDAALDAFMRQEARRLEDEARAFWREGQEAAQRRHRSDADERQSYWHEYDVRGRTRLLVALNVTRWDYTGGAHGNGWSDSLIWDRQRRRTLSFSSLFTDWPAAQRLLREPVCIAVDRAQFVREGGNADDYSPFDDGSDPDLPEGCPAVADVTLVPAGSLDQPFDRLLIRHTSGVYIEGITDAEIPVTADFIRLLSPRWRSAFRAAPVDAPAPSP